MIKKQIKWLGLLFKKISKPSLVGIFVYLLFFCSFDVVAKNRFSRSCHLIFSRSSSKKTKPTKILPEFNNLGRLVAGLREGTIQKKHLMGQTIAIPKSLGLRSTVKHGRILHLKPKNQTSKGVVFFVGGLFTSAEDVKEKEYFTNEFLERGLEFIYFELGQGYSMAEEIIENDNSVPRAVPHQDQQTLLAFYILKTIIKNQWPIFFPKILVGHSYGGWLANEFLANPEFNGRSQPSNSLLNRHLRRLRSLGLIRDSSFSGAINTFLPLDSGLGSLHFPNPQIAQAASNYPEPFSQITDYYLAQLMRVYYENLNDDIKHDPFKMQANIALYLGIRHQYSVQAPEYIPDDISVFNIVAGNSRLIPRSWHNSYLLALKKSSSDFHHRASFILQDLPHDFLNLPGVGQFLSDLILGEQIPEGFLNHYDLKMRK